MFSRSFSTRALLPLAATALLWLCAPGHGLAQAPSGAAAPASPTPSQTSPGPIGPTSATANGATTSAGNSTQTPAASRTAADRAVTDRAAADRRADFVPAQGLPQDAPTEFQSLVASTTGRPVPIFGASLFYAPPTTFAPVEDVPVGPGYIIGPGDELRIQLSGQVTQQITVTVDRTGAISLPDLGQVHVAGIAYGQLAAYLRQQASRLYRNFDLSVNLGSLRSIQIFVFGNARRPGTYTISSLSTLVNALFASGGPSPQGSLRDIRVTRGNKVIAHFDLYDLLLHGDKSSDLNLATGDTIFIPTVGPQVAVVGSVSTPAIYELKGETTIAEVLALAGGETNVASGSSVRLEHIFQHAMRSVEDATLSTGSDHLVQDGDILSVGSITDRFRDAVTLRGNVANPGRYPWHQGMRISDLIPNKEALITRNYWRKRNALGQLAGNPFGEGALIAAGPAPAGNGVNDSNAGGNSVGDALTANNNLFNPSTDVLLSAPDIDLSYAVIERQSTIDLTTSLVPFNLGKIILDGDPAQNLELLPGDVITIFSKADIRVPTSQQTRFVRLEGEFASPGVYSVLPGETLRGLLVRAGGMTNDAYLYASEFTRESTRRVEQQRLREYADQLEAQISATTASSQARALSANDQGAAAASAANAQAAVARLRAQVPIGRIVLDLRPNSVGPNSVPDLALEDGDRFVVPRIPSNVTVQGQVYSANAFVYTPGHRVLDYLKQAGGPDRQADRKRSFVLRADGSVVSRQYANVDHALIYPGDTIVMPPVIDKRATLQRVIDIATIAGQLGLSIATVGLLATR